MISSNPILFSGAFVSISLLLADVICLSVDGRLTVGSHSTVSVSVPLFPTTVDHLGLFIGIAWTSSDPCDFVAVDLPANLTHEFSLSEVVNPYPLHDISVQHNFRCYSIGLMVVDEPWQWWAGVERFAQYQGLSGSRRRVRD
jgi:hypothetical protein